METQNTMNVSNAEKRSIVEKELSLKNVAILCSQNLVYCNDEVVVLTYQGFTVKIELAKTNTSSCVCVVTLMYELGGKLKKELFCMTSITQLMRWLSCIRKHNKMMYVIGSCKKVEDIAKALECEPFHLLSRLNDAINT